MATTTVTLWLFFGMDALFDNAVADGRAYPFTGQADDLAFPPGAAALSEIPMVIATLLLAYVGGQRILQGRLGWKGLSVLAVLSIFLWEPLLWFVVAWLGSSEFELYSSWYRPVLVVSCITYALLLLASTALLAYASGRRESIGR